MNQIIGKQHSNEEIHTLLIGTSKSQKGEKYFCKGANISKFWGTLSKANSNFVGKEETSKLISNGVLFRDISSAKGGQEKKDKEIKAISLQQGFNDLDNILTNNPSIERIGFIGKQAAQWFFIRFIDKIKLLKKDLLFMDNLFKYGKQQWNVNFGNKKIDCFVLTNTGRQWKREVWEVFWKEEVKINQRNANKS